MGGSTGNHLEARFIENPNHQYMTVSESHLRLNQQSQHNIHLSHNHQSEEMFDDGCHQLKGMNFQQVAKNIDETSRIVFPIAFTLFVICYWLYYLFT